MNMRFVHPFLWVGVAAIGIGTAFRFLPPTQIFQATHATRFITVLASVYWLYFIVGALRVNTTALGGVRAVRKLVTHGPYGVVRHPMYSAHIALAWGLFLSYPSIRVFLSVLWLSTVLLSWIQLEERALMQKFGDKYRLYRQQVPMLIPRLHTSAAREK